MRFAFLAGASALDIAVLIWAVGRFDVPLWVVAAYFLARAVQTIYAALKWQDLARAFVSEFDDLQAKYEEAQVALRSLQNSVDLQSRLIADLLDHDRNSRS